MPLDPNLIDVDWQPWRPGDPPVDGRGGLIEDPESYKEAARMCGSFPTNWVIPRSEWPDRIREREANGVTLWNYCDAKNNQHPESSCVQNAMETCHRIIRNKQAGVDVSRNINRHLEVWCSPMSSYVRVTRRRHSGSYMHEAIEVSVNGGQLPESEQHQASGIYQHTFQQNTPWPGSGGSSELPDGWEVTAKHFRSLEWYWISNRDEFGSALLNDWPICYGRGGHSICAIELLLDGGKYYARYMDSYGFGRGQRGTLLDSESRWNTGGAWCLRSVRTPDDWLHPAGSDGGAITV